MGSHSHIFILILHLHTYFIAFIFTLKPTCSGPEDGQQMTETISPI